MQGFGASGSDIVRSGWNGTDLHDLDLPLSSVAADTSSLADKHKTYPILHYYHSENRENASAPAVAALDEALTLIRFGSSDERLYNGAVVENARARRAERAPAPAARRGARRRLELAGAVLMSDLVFFSSGWLPLVRIVVVGTLMYVVLVALLRVSGSRTIASMRAFDFIVTVALGSVFGRALTAKGVSLAEAVVAFVLLIALQYVVARTQVSSPWFARAVTNPARLLYFRGEFQRDAMQRARVTEQELRAVARKNGTARWTRSRRSSWRPAATSPFSRRSATAARSAVSSATRWTVPRRDGGAPTQARVFRTSPVRPSSRARSAGSSPRRRRCRCGSCPRRARRGTSGRWSRAG